MRAHTKQTFIIQDCRVNTIIYKHTDRANPNQEKFLSNAIKAYENFIDFLHSDSDVIDYTYLWDIITTPNPVLFPQGLIRDYRRDNILIINKY